MIRKRSNSTEEPSRKAKVKTRFMLDFTELVPNTDEDKKEDYSLNHSYFSLNVDPNLFDSMTFNLLGPLEFTKKLGLYIMQNGGKVDEEGIRIAPSLRWVRDNDFIDPFVLLPSFIADSIKNNKLEDQSKHTFLNILANAPFIQPGDLVTPGGPSLWIPREAPATDYVNMFATKGSHNCFYGHSQAGKSTFVKTFVVPQLVKRGFQVI